MSATYDEDDIKRLGDVIAENIINEFRTGLEAIEEIKVQVNKIPAMQDDIEVLKTDMTAVKKAIRATNDDLHTLQGDVCVLKEDVALLKTNVIEIKTDLKTLTNRTGRLEAAVYHAA